MKRRLCASAESGVQNNGFHSSVTSSAYRGTHIVETKNVDNGVNSTEKNANHLANIKFEKMNSNLQGQSSEENDDDDDSKKQ